MLARNRPKPFTMEDMVRILNKSIIFHNNLLLVLFQPSLASQVVLGPGIPEKYKKSPWRHPDPPHPNLNDLLNHSIKVQVNSLMLLERHLDFFLKKNLEVFNT